MDAVNLHAGGCADRAAEALARMGDTALPAVSRMRAVDELAALADEWLADTSVKEQARNRRAQGIITALCDYLRSPANDCDTAPADAAHLSPAGRIRTHILDTIRQHVRWRENPHQWGPCTLS